MQPKYLTTYRKPQALPPRAVRMLQQTKPRTFPTFPGRKAMTFAQTLHGVFRNSPYPDHSHTLKKSEHQSEKISSEKKGEKCIQERWRVFLAPIVEPISVSQHTLTPFSKDMRKTRERLTINGTESIMIPEHATPHIPRQHPYLRRPCHVQTFPW